MKRFTITIAAAVALFAVLVTSTSVTSCGEKAQPPKAENKVDSSLKATTLKPQSPDTVSRSSETKAAKEEEKLHPVYMGVWGGVGGTGFMFDMNGTEGSYIPYDMAEAKEYGERRQLKLVSYDPKDGTCIINAYLKGKYIGQFKGTFEESELKMEDGGTYTYQAYDGIFTSAKGAKLDFHFHFD